MNTKNLKNGIFIIALLICHVLMCQNNNIGIGTTTPHQSAALDIVSNNQGLLTPRLTSAQRLAIVQPALGLLVFDTDLNEFWFFNGTTWAPIQPAATGNLLFSALEPIIAPANTNENQLSSFFIPANTLNNGEGIIIRAFGNCANDNTTFRFKLATNDVTVPVDNSGNFSIELTLFRRSALNGKGYWTTAEKTGTFSYTLNFDGGIPFQLTGQASQAQANGIVLEGLIIERIR
jgi:hypothetical protein